jgi:hypothetical protein
MLSVSIAERFFKFKKSSLKLQLFCNQLGSTPLPLPPIPSTITGKALPATQKEGKTKIKVRMVAIWAVPTEVGGWGKT